MSVYYFHIYIQFIYRIIYHSRCIEVFDARTHPTDTKVHVRMPIKVWGSRDVRWFAGTSWLVGSHWTPSAASPSAADASPAWTCRADPTLTLSAVRGRVLSGHRDAASTSRADSIFVLRIVVLFLFSLTILSLAITHVFAVRPFSAIPMIAEYPEYSCPSSVPSG